MAGFKSILVISDTHIPFNHADVVSFLRHLKKKHKPDRVVHIGDEIDFHAISFHDSDPDLMSPGDELKTAIRRLKPLYKLFPEMDLLESNHGSLVYRKGKHHGLPRSVLKSYRDVLEAPPGWRWHFELILPMSNGEKVYFHHGKSANGLKLSQAMGMATVQGHHHETMAVQYWGNPLGLYWSMQVGCLIEKSTLAFEYCKNNMKRPLIGTGVIRNGLPILEPMILNKRGRWVGP
jgi:hypothetical protein